MASGYLSGGPSSRPRSVRCCSRTAPTPSTPQSELLPDSSSTERGVGRAGEHQGAAGDVLHNTLLSGRVTKASEVGLLRPSVGVSAVTLAGGRLRCTVRALDPNVQGGGDWCTVCRALLPNADAVQCLLPAVCVLPQRCRVLAAACRCT